MTIGSSPGIQTKSRIPEPEAIESLYLRGYPRSLVQTHHRQRSQNPEWSGLGDRRVGELHVNPGAPKLYTKEDQVHFPGARENKPKKRGFTFLMQHSWKKI